MLSAERNLEFPINLQLPAPILKSRVIILCLPPLQVNQPTYSSAENSNSVQQPISDDGQTEVAVGHVSDNHGTSAKISTDHAPGDPYAPGDTAVITVEDPDADVDDSVINTVTIVVG